MTEEGLVLMDVGFSDSAPFVALIVCGANITWRQRVRVCLVVLPMSRT